MDGEYSADFSIDFFFQAEDSIRGIGVTGVQTCALPIFLCARAAFPHMRERGHGRIINVASITFFIGWSGFLDYVSSKGAVIGFTRTLAREVGPEGITVNAISPGAFPTDAERVHPDQEALNRRILDQQSLKRRGTPEDVGNLAAFLASDAASFITGQTVMIDGGWAMH